MGGFLRAILFIVIIAILLIAEIAIRLIVMIAIILIVIMTILATGLHMGRFLRAANGGTLTLNKKLLSGTTRAADVEWSPLHVDGSFLMQASSSG